jgi:hypothetical protein
MRESTTTLIVMCFCKTNSVSSTYKRGSEQNLLLSSVDYGKPIKYLSHESSNFCRRMMFWMCIWFVASIFLLSRRQKKHGAVILEYDLVQYTKSYDLLMHKVYHSNARSKM